MKDKRKSRRRRRSGELVDTEDVSTDTENAPSSDSSSTDHSDFDHVHVDFLETDATGTRAAQNYSQRHGPRVVLVNQNQVHKFCCNRISTAKYSFCSFLPIFLYEQFHRYSNIFFLLMVILQQIPGVSPTGRWTTLVPLLFILACSALKEMLEDVERHNADDDENDRQVEVVHLRQWKWIKWESVTVGDILRVQNNSFFPADMLILTTSDPHGMCFIETANLDGETNLKIRQPITDTVGLRRINLIIKYVARIECNHPNKMLYEFQGVLYPEVGESSSLGPDQMLLRGSRLRNTNWAVGVALYTGNDTKLRLNSTKAQLKRSTVDKLTNKMIIIMFVILAIMVIISSGACYYWNWLHEENHWYIGSTADALISHIGLTIATFLLLYNNLIPISLQVTVEIVRVIQAIFISNDVEMYDKETDTPAVARTSNLNEELGMIQYVFSDKTGTLTRNIMEFKKCSIGGIIYFAHEKDSVIAKVLNDNKSEKHAIVIKEFLTLITICHTVIPEKVRNGVISYHASSQDERALLYGARRFGYIFEARTPSYIEIRTPNGRQRFEILQMLDFTSRRRMMSVIVKTPSGKIRIYSKGAEKVIYERLAAEGAKYEEGTVLHLNAFAKEGLRILCCAMAEVSDVVYQNWREEFRKATLSLDNRVEKMEDAATLIETGLILLGATAIEDKLQDDVPETIAALLKADIHVWILTGDKQETAINIGLACNVLLQDLQVMILNDITLKQTRADIKEYLKIMSTENDGKKNYQNSLVIDGSTLIFALNDKLKPLFLKLCLQCRSVICCRVSPLQKAEVVNLIKGTGHITLAIGDGANDCPMLQCAHVGVGIQGAEGLQAVGASDYAIAKFKFLRRLLFVHGAWNYNRICKVILYCFYKNICMYIIQFWFAFYNGWSGQILFERWSIGFYNLFFTGLPPFAIGIFDKVCSAEAMLKYPELYKPSQRSELFNVRIFWFWFFNAVIHSIILFWLTKWICKNDILWQNGFDGGSMILGNFVYTYVVVTVCLKALLISNYWSVIIFLAIFGSIIIWLALFTIYCYFWPTFPIASVMTRLHIMIFTSFDFWIGLILIPIFVIAFDLLLKVIIPEIAKIILRRRKSDRQDGYFYKILDSIRNVYDTSQFTYPLMEKTLSAEDHRIREIENAKNPPKNRIKSDDDEDDDDEDERKEDEKEAPSSLEKVGKEEKKLESALKTESMHTVESKKLKTEFQIDTIDK